MRILITTLTISEKCGLGRYSLDLIRELAKNNELIVYTASDDKEVKLGFKTQLKVKIHYIFPGESKIFRIMRPWLFLKYLLMILPQARRCDLIHSMMDFPYAFLASVIGLAVRKPVVSTAHGTYSIVPLTISRWAGLAKWTFRHLSRIICVSNFTKNEILKKVSAKGRPAFGWDVENCVVINNGINLERFDDAIEGEVGQLHLQDKISKIILSVGMLKHRKGYQVSIPAVGLVRKKYPNLRYYIVGRQNDKDYFDKLKRLVKECRLEDNVVFWENISDDELTRLYKQADLFLLTPVYLKGNFEGFGLVYLEAGVYSKPVVASFGSGAAEAVVDNKTGFLVLENNIEATAEAILKLLDSPVLAGEMGRAGRQFAREHAWKKVALKYQKVYDEVVRGKGVRFYEN